MRGAGGGGRVGFVLTFVAVLGVGCVGSEERRPVPDSTMVDLLIELHLSVARAEFTNEIPPDIRDSIFTAYDVDSTTYAQAITYYAEHPDEYAEIYSRVLDRLNSERHPLGQASENNSAAPPARLLP